MNKTFSLTCAQYSGLGLRTILADDQENLRNWKNARRDSFFFKEVITPINQQAWFATYLARENDFMFIITIADAEIGCMGFRLYDNAWDIYNVILGSRVFRGKGYMGQALHLMWSYAFTLQPLRITARVLNTNPALHWYYRNGFQAAVVHSDHTEIELDDTIVGPCRLVEVSQTETEMSTQYSYT